jgi:hypothetical protein
VKDYAAAHFPPPPDPEPADGGPKRRYLCGLDLGRQADFSAFAAAERTETTEGGRKVRRYSVQALHRWPLKTPYTAVVADVVKMFDGTPVEGAILGVDVGGVGMAVFDFLRKARPRAVARAVLITAGARATQEDGVWHVPKCELAGVLGVLLGGRRLEIAPALPLAKVLAGELGTFSAKANVVTGNISYEALRQRDHDDLVLAVAMAAWMGERTCLTPWAIF